MRRRPDVEIIEVLSPDDPLLDAEPILPGASAPPAAAHGSTRRRRVRIAGVVVIALAVGGWVATSGDDEAPEAAATTTTQPRQRLTPEPEVGDHYLLDSAVLQPYSADIVTAPPQRSIYRLWGTTADRPWWSVEAAPGELGDHFFVDAKRSIVDGVEIIRQATTATLVTVRDFGDGWVGVVTTSGMSEQAHVLIVNGLRHEGDDIVDSTSLADGFGLERLAWTATAAQWLYGDVTSQVRSLTADGTMVTLRVGTGSIEERRMALPFVSGGPAGYTDTGVNGSRLDTGETIAIWADGDVLLSLTAALPLNELYALRDAVAPVTDQAWATRMYGVTADYRLGEGHVLATGSGWFAGVQTARRAGRDVVLWWWGTDDGGVHTVEAPEPVGFATGTPRSVVTPGATYVFVTSPSGNGLVELLDGADEPLSIAVQSIDSVPGYAFGVARVSTPGAVHLDPAAA
ncbi:MAG: hypothetical protein ABMA25_24710 [Ilumatobacteraceae bacterium]